MHPYHRLSKFEGMLMCVQHCTLIGIAVIKCGSLCIPVVVMASDSVGVVAAVEVSKLSANG